MSPVIYNDVLAAVSVVAATPPEHQRRVAEILLWRADQAEAYRRSAGAVHPRFGDGSLMAAAMQYGASGDVSFQSVEGVRAWLCVLGVMQARMTADAGAVPDRC